MTQSGYFSEDGSVYIIENMYPSRPWYNFSWNRNFILQMDQFGCGKSWHYTDKGLRTNHNARGTASDLGTVSDNRLLFLRDAETGNYWSPNRNFKKEKYEIFSTEVHQGWSTVVAKHQGILCRSTFFVPDRGAVECWKIEVSNESESKRNLNLFSYSSAPIENFVHAPCQRGDFDKEANLLYTHYQGPAIYTELVCMFMTASEKADAWETTARRFFGVYGLLSDPEAVKAGLLSSKGTNFEWQNAHALQFNLELDAGEKREIRILSGLSKSPTQALIENKDKLSQEFFNQQLKAKAQEASSRSNRLKIKTGEKDIDALVSSWLKQQISLGKDWGRVYAKGFRDIMQDTAAFVSFCPKQAGENIGYCLTYQHEDGGTERQWNPSWKHPFRDGAAWIAPALTAYIKETGDEKILKKEIPFYESDKSASVLEHALRGINYLLDGVGEKGLCLWGGGDWNDSINMAGLKGRGESLWLSMAAVVSAKDMMKLLNRLGMSKQAQKIKTKMTALIANIKKHGWDKDHFITGINDEGKRIGSYESQSMNYMLNPQTWAILSEVADDPHALMKQTEEKLKTPYGYMLCKPPASKGDSSVGLATYMVEGCCENGSVYNHGNAFKIAADCKLGRAEEAYKTLKMILPNNPENLTSGVEPYALTNQYLGPDNPWRAGEANGSWITGTAGWVFRCVSEYMLGIQADYDGLNIHPCLPRAWNGTELLREFRGLKFHIRYEYKKLEKIQVLCNGKLCEGGFIALSQAKPENEVQVFIPSDS